MVCILRPALAPLDRARIQSLMSLKNSQNNILQTNTKRKADLLDYDDTENVDPSLFAKRSKGVSSFMLKPSAYVLTTAAATPTTEAGASRNPFHSGTAPRRIMKLKSRSNRLSTTINMPSPLPAPAGRSPTLSKRSCLPSTRIRSSEADSCTRDESRASDFLGSALNGTIRTFGSRPRSNAVSKESSSSTQSPLIGLNSVEGWFFDIHEDTPDEEMTNMLQHRTCTLDISSDEEIEQRESREKAEGRDKENVPPFDDRSQSPPRRSDRASHRAGGDKAEKERIVLGEMNAAELLASERMFFEEMSSKAETCVTNDSEAGAAAVENTVRQEHPIE
ncbi:hypothetical protein E4U57_001358 [Claviceps arundinis]|uniref:Uncharacterized protein n=1 Tax=Claviceps arundinis TaxID=1623583 RepID=A0A9P7SN20_9HYPO|nr:hypothetical protein E4U57_001358 [Claviceps arundinis]KAG5964483.1 hypothetical protein E4U56_002189 [Claviceps arundinis]